jgi:undecaprenyl diphosphate synthase
MNQDPAQKVEHLAIIMDGNRRWAKAKGLPGFAGHREGVESLKAIVKRCPDVGIKYLTVFVFSTENWSRQAEEVNFLFDLLKKVLEYELAELIKQGVRIRFLGDLEAINPELRFQLQNACDVTKHNNKLQLQIALNYGGRADITTAAKILSAKVRNGELKPEEITSELFEKHLYTDDIPAPDLLIRTGGETRISNFLLWQLAYSELIFTDTFWPDFRKKDLDICLEEFVKRKRRFGK